jgi:hypothetical protein
MCKIACVVHMTCPSSLLDMRCCERSCLGRLLGVLLPFSPRLPCWLPLFSYSFSGNNASYYITKLTKLFRQHCQCYFLSLIKECFSARLGDEILPKALLSQAYLKHV